MQCLEVLLFERLLGNEPHIWLLDRGAIRIPLRHTHGQLD
jgi:hypothetical protein